MGLKNDKDRANDNLFSRQLFHIFSNCRVKLSGWVFFLPYDWINVSCLVEGLYQKVNIQGSMKATEFEQYVSEQALNCLS